MDRRPALDEFIERSRDVDRRVELDSAAAAVLEGFEAAGVRSLLLKGPVLARVLYTEDEQRGYLDIDLLVSPEDLAAARAVLTALGYGQADEAFAVEHVTGVVHGELWTQRGKGGPLWVDLHARLGGCRAPDEDMGDPVERAHLD